MRRLLEESDDAFMLTVLESAGLDTPTDQAMQRAGQALGVGVLGLAVLGSSASGWSKLVASVSASKVIVVAIVVAVVAATWHGAAPAKRTTLHGQVTRAASLPSAPPTSAEPLRVVAAPHAPATARPPKKQKPVPVTAEPPPKPKSLGDEVSMLDRARSAMALGRPGDAVRILTSFANEFPNAVLAAEALILGAEASLAAGDRAAAHHKASSYLARYPHGSHTQRASRLLDASR